MVIIYPGFNISKLSVILCLGIMPILNIFLVLGVLALIYSFVATERSAIWGGATLGLIVGIIIGIFNKDFSNIFRAILIGADVGLAAEILGFLGDRLRMRGRK